MIFGKFDEHASERPVHPPSEKHGVTPAAAQLPSQLV
jgi:hypothetical protein